MRSSNSNELYHYGILGMKWGVRRYQNPDGSLTEAGRRHYDKADYKWAKKNNSKIIAKTEKKVSRELNDYAKRLSKSKGYLTKKGTISKSAINKYNSKMAELMNKNVDAISSPSGKTVQFVAKRGDIGVYMALVDPYANISNYSNGIWSTGRIAYRNQNVDKIEI